MREIDRLNAKLRGFRVLKGAEVNIDRDGTLDIDDETLAELDVVGVAVHSHFNSRRRPQPAGALDRLIRGGRVKDLRACATTSSAGLWTRPGGERRQSRSKYGAKTPKGDGAK